MDKKEKKGKRKREEMDGVVSYCCEMISRKKKQTSMRQRRRECETDTHFHPFSFVADVFPREPHPMCVLLPQGTTTVLVVPIAVFFLLSFFRLSPFSVCV